MATGYPIELTRALARLGYSSLTDLFIVRPNLSLWTAAPLLSEETSRFAPVELERALRIECERRKDFHFFARIALFTALHSHNDKGWSRQHYLLAGAFAGILGELAEQQARLCWDYLQTLPLPEGWTPDSIFHPTLEAALNSGFPTHPTSPSGDQQS